MVEVVRFKLSAITNFQKCGPDDAVRDKVLEALEKLKRDPNLGYEIPFIHPEFRQFQVDGYKIHYDLSNDKKQILVLYVGILGKC